MEDILVYLGLLVELVIVVYFCFIDTNNVKKRSKGKANTNEKKHSNKFAEQLLTEENIYDNKSKYLDNDFEEDEPTFDFFKEKKKEEKHTFNFFNDIDEDDEINFKISSDDKKSKPKSKFFNDEIKESKPKSNLFNKNRKKDKIKFEKEKNEEPKFDFFADEVKPEKTIDKSFDEIDEEKPAFNFFEEENSKPEKYRSKRNNEKRF